MAARKSTDVRYGMVTAQYLPLAKPPLLYGAPQTPESMLGRVISAFVSLPFGVVAHQYNFRVGGLSDCVTHRCSRSIAAIPVLRLMFTFEVGHSRTESSQKRLRTHKPVVAIATRSAMHPAIRRQLLKNSRIGVGLEAQPLQDWLVLDSVVWFWIGMVRPFWSVAIGRRFSRADDEDHGSDCCRDR